MLLALVIALFLWGVAQGSTDIRYSFDIPVQLTGVDDSLVVTDQNTNEVNVGVVGSRAALRNLEEDRMTYEIDISNVKPGQAEFEVDLGTIQLPRRARFNNHSPSRIVIRLERKTRKEVSVVPDIQGELVPGFALAEVRVVPDRVWLEGAKSHVMRIAEVKTEPIDVSELRESTEIEARLIILGGDTVWAEDETPVTVQIVLDPVPLPDPDSLEILDGVPPVPAEEEARRQRDSGGRLQG
jgi:YbbR domain-containing protein